MATEAMTRMFLCYQDELREYYDLTKTRIEEFQNEAKDWIDWAKTEAEIRKEKLQPLLIEKKHELTDMLNDQTPITSAEQDYVRDIYGWLSVCFTGFIVGQTVAQILTPIIGGAFNTSTVFILAYLMLPAYYWLIHRKLDMPEKNRRAYNLTCSTAFGACIAFLFYDVQFAFYAPPAFVFPLAISIMNGMINTPSRTAWLAGAIGAGIGGYMIYGFVMGLPMIYLLFVTAYAGLVFVDMQIKIGRYRNRDAECEALEQLHSIYGHTVFVSLMYILFAHSNDQSVHDLPPSVGN